METIDERKCVSIKRGVPQSTVLGPTLWNILYENLFDVEIPTGAPLVGFTDDVATPSQLGTRKF